MEREVRTNQGFLVPWEARVATFASLPAPALVERLLAAAID